MAYRPSKRRHLESSREDLNLTPVLNIFIIIIPFLLLTAVFAKTAIIDIYLPQETGSFQQAGAAAATLSVNVAESGFKLGGIGNGVTIPKVGNRYNYRQLSQELAKIKDRYPQKEDIVLLIEPHLPYETTIKVMDAARETSDGVKKSLFPLVSLGEAGK